MEFKHNPDHNRLRANPEQPITDFSQLKSPTGGDQVMVMKIAGGKPSEPIAVTPGGGDLYRPAIAMDGAGRLWVFWSQNDKGNFDMWGRVIDNGKPGPTVRISSAPVRISTPSRRPILKAACGWRGRDGATGRPRSFRRPRTATGSRAPAAVSSSTGNEWNPAIAADGDWTRYRRLGFVSQRELRRLHAHRERRRMGSGNGRGRIGALRSVSIHRLRSVGPACGSPMNRAANAGARISAPMTPPGSRCIRVARCNWSGSIETGA